MTAPDRTTDPAQRSRLLRLYPVRYRDLHGSEIAEVHAEATAELSGLPLLREHADLAAHALRLRLRLGSTDPAGRIAAGAAPFALAAAAGVSLLLGVVLAPGVLAGQLSPGWTALTAADDLPWVVALLCALTGRWAAARVFALLATAVKIALLIVAPSSHLWIWAFVAGEDTPWLWFSVVLGVMVVLAPPDLVDVGPRRNRQAIGAAAVLGAPLVAGLGRVLGHHSPGSPLDLLLRCCPGLVAAAAVLVVLTRPRTDLLRAVGIGLTAVPWAVALSQDDQLTVHHLAGATALVCVPLAGAALLAAVVRPARARALAEPLDPA
jgi:hypothetical protein